MKRILLAVLAVSALQGCVLRIPGLNIGGAPASSSSSSSGSSGATSAPSVMDSAATKAWRGVLNQKRDALESLYERINDQPKPGSTSPDQHADWALKLINNDQLAEVAQGCAAKTYDGEELKFDQRDAYLKASTMCPLVVDRIALLKKTVHAWGVAVADYYFWQEENRIERIAKEGKVSTGLLEEAQSAQKMKEYVASFAKKTFESIGEPVPPEALAKADTLFAKRQDTIMKLAAAGKMDVSKKADGGAEKAIREVYARRFDVKKVIMTDADWKLVKNDYGVLLRHYKDASVLVKAKDGSFCALIPASVGQPYEDNGKYANTYGVDEFIEAFPVKCP